MEKRVELDLWSPWLDIKILQKTFVALIGQKEAY
jgi:lipopolysaccharide/colanic/teichoic acid biosynthesis glycosyltransferase